MNSRTKSIHCVACNTYTVVYTVLFWSFGFDIFAFLFDLLNIENIIANLNNTCKMYDVELAE